MSMIDAKLLVYTKYEGILSECEEKEKGSTRHILLHHEVEDYENICKSSAIQRLTKLYNTFTSIKNNIPKESSIDTIVLGTFNSILSKKNIQRICNEIDLWMDSCHIGKVGDAYLCTNSKTQSKIRTNLIKKSLEKIEVSLSKEIYYRLFEYVTLIPKANNKEYFRNGDFQSTPNPISLHLKPTANDMRQPTNEIHKVDVNSVLFRTEIADIVYKEVLRKEGIIKKKIKAEIRTICEKTTHELQTIAARMRLWKNNMVLPDLLESIFFFLRYYQIFTKHFDIKFAIIRPIVSRIFNS